MDNNHPFFLIYNDFLMKRKGNLGDCTFFLSKYIYIPDSIDDNRIRLEVKGNEFTEERIQNELSLLEENEELAFHSKIRIKDKFYHFPFIDFAIPVNDWDFEQDFIRLKRIIPHIASTLGLFNSGRSLHGYSLKLLTRKEWIDFIGDVKWCIVWSIRSGHAFNSLREGKEKIADAGLNMYTKNFEEPTEGIVYKIY